MTVREITSADLAAVSALDERIFPESPWGQAAFSENLKNSYDHCFLAEDEDGPAGFALLRTLDAGELLLIGTAPERRRRGTGQLLLEAVIGCAEACGMSTLLLEVRSGNVPAAELYRNNGFRTILTRRGYYLNPQEDALVMERKLTGELC